MCLVNSHLLTKKKHVALLELKDSITFGDRVKPICIADDDTIPIDRSVATVSGWGWTSEDRILGKFEKEININSFGVCGVFVKYHSL